IGVGTDLNAKPPNPKVAIIEDESQLRDLYSLVLKDRGYDIVFRANCGEEVIIAIAEGKLSGLDIAILDYRLGSGINGLQTARLILQSKPNVRIIIATADDSIQCEVRAAGFFLLKKPFTIIDLLRVSQPF
ncbi:MAG: response regulator, partial [Nitrososphaerales archaeon]